MPCSKRIRFARTSSSTNAHFDDFGCGSALGACAKPRADASIAARQGSVNFICGPQAYPIIANSPARCDPGVATMTTRFRAEQVGSLLRPAALLEARAA